MAGKDQRNGKTNGLDTGRRKKGEIPAPRTLFSSTLFMIGVGLYCLSLLWPVDSFSPAWVAFPLAIAGIAILLISLRSFWEKAPV